MSGSKYNPDDYPRQVEQLCRREGFHRQIMADKFSVSVETIDRWRQVHPEFAEAMMRGVADNNVVAACQALNQRLTGYYYSEVIERPDPKTGKMKICKTVKRHVPPDTNAIKYFLNNKDSGNWQDRQNHTVVGTIQLAPAKVNKAKNAGK